MPKEKLRKGRRSITLYVSVQDESIISELRDRLTEQSMSLSEFLAEAARTYLHKPSIENRIKAIEEEIKKWR
jgi:hypothetical protein